LLGRALGSGYLNKCFSVVNYNQELVSAHFLPPFGCVLIGKISPC
jgi:hypothetical protein